MDDLYSTDGDYGLMTLAEPPEAIVEYLSSNCSLPRDLAEEYQQLLALSSSTDLLAIE